MASSAPLPRVTIDASLRPYDLLPGFAYWEPADAASSAVVAAERCLPGVADWQRVGLQTVYRLVPWYSFGTDTHDSYIRRKDLLDPVRSGGHIPVIRVSPDCPGSIALAASLISPVLEFPDGPDSIHAGPLAMWHESIVPIGHGNCSDMLTTPEKPNPLPRSNRVVWVRPVLGMTAEPMAADMTVLVELLQCFQDVGACLAADKTGGIWRDVGWLEGRLSRALFPLVAVGLGECLNLYRTPWPTSALVASRFLGEGMQFTMRDEDTDKERADREFADKEFAMAATKRLWKRFSKMPLPLAVHRQFVANGLCDRSATPCLPGTPEADSVLRSTVPDLEDLAAALSRCVPDLPDALGGRHADGERKQRARTQHRLEGMHGRMHGFLVALGEVRNRYVAGEPIIWRAGQSTMHLARRFGLLVDPLEAWHSRPSTDRPPGTNSAPPDILPLATDTAGRPLAFAKRVGDGFAVVVPDDADFTDERVDQFVRFATEHWSLACPIAPSATASQGQSRDQQDQNAPVAATSSLSDFRLHIDLKNCTVSWPASSSRKDVSIPTISTPLRSRSGRTPFQSARLLACLSKHANEGVSLDMWNRSCFHPAHPAEGKSGGTSENALEVAICKLRGDLWQGVLRKASAGIPEAQEDLVPSKGEGAACFYRLDDRCTVTKEFEQWVLEPTGQRSAQVRP